MGALDGIAGSYDAVVIGARAAGAATAAFLARAGLRVLAVDRGAYGSDTLSTHALMRAGVLQLVRLGVLERIVAEGTPAVRRTVFHYEDGPLDVPIRAKDGVPALFAPRRTLLDRVLVDAAAAAGACVRHRVRLAELSRRADGRVDGVRLVDEAGAALAVRAGIVIGADGLRSTVASLVGAPVTQRGRHAAASVYGYWEGLDVDGYHWHWSRGSAAGAIPTNGGQVLVFAGVTADRFACEIARDVRAGYAAVLAEAAPGLSPALSRARLVGSLRGFAGAPALLRRPWGPGWALVGDAGYFKDPVTAHGLSDALRDAELLASAVEQGGDAALLDYEQRRDELSRELLEVTDEIASLEWDNDALKLLHQRLSDAMKREVKTLVALHEARGASAPKSASAPDADRAGRGGAGERGGSRGFECLDADDPAGRTEGRALARRAATGHPAVHGDQRGP